MLRETSALKKVKKTIKNNKKQLGKNIRKLILILLSSSSSSQNKNAVYVYYSIILVIPVDTQYNDYLVPRLITPTHKFALNLPNAIYSHMKMKYACVVNTVQRIIMLFYILQSVCNFEQTRNTNVPISQHM